MIGKIFTIIGLIVFLIYSIYTAVSHGEEMKQIVKKHYKDRDNELK